jgi:hypothetical protein
LKNKWNITIKIIKTEKTIYQVKKKNNNNKNSEQTNKQKIITKMIKKNN